MTKRINLDMLARFAQGLKNKFAKKSEAVASITGESGGNRTIAYTRADGTMGSFSYYGTSDKASDKVYHGLVMPDITALSPKYTGYVFQTTDEELWKWGTDPVQVKPEGDFFFLDTENTILYQWTGSQLVAVNNIATNLDLRAGDGMLIEAGTFSSLGVIGGAVYTDKDAAINIPAAGTYAFNAATGKLYTAGMRMVHNTASRYLKEIVPPKVFFFYDTAEGKLYFWNGAALTQK